MLSQQTFILDHFGCYLSSRTCPQVYTDVITPVVLPFPRGHACLRQKNSTDRRARPRRGPPVLPEGLFISSRKACGVDGGFCLSISASTHFYAGDQHGRASLPDARPMC